MENKIKKQIDLSGDCYLKIRVIPNSSKTEFKEIMADGSYKISLNALPERGKANKELVKFLSKTLKIPKENIVIASGLTSRIKVIHFLK